MHSYSFSRMRRAFTLIELLVVIAIIAILAAILFPVFAKAREKARQITCVSNQKQIGIAILQYVQDYDETLPPSNYNDPLTGNAAIGLHSGDALALGLAHGAQARLSGGDVEVDLPVVITRAVPRGADARTCCRGNPP